MQLWSREFSTPATHFVHFTTIPDHINPTMDSDMSASRNGEDIDMDDLNGPQKDEELTLEDVIISFPNAFACTDRRQTDTLLTELFKEYSDVDNRRMQLNGRIQGLFAHRRALQGDDATDVKSCEVPGLVTKIKKPR
jgi:hypothetical protein